MQLKIILLLTIFFGLNSFACEIKSFKYLLRFNNKLDEGIIKNSQCSSEIKKEFIDLLRNADGKVSAKIISTIIFEKQKNKVFISPNEINIKNLNDILSVKNLLKQNQKIHTVLAANRISYVTSSSPIQIELESLNYLNVGENNLNIKINNKNIWMNILVQQKKNIWTATEEIYPFNKNLKKTSFKKEVIYDHKNTQYLKDINLVKYYKTNKRINKGTPLKLTDLTPLYLVRHGKKVNLILKGNNIKIKNNAIAKQNGRYGDNIEFQNIRSKKSFFANVIDFNTVEVDL